MLYFVPLPSTGFHYRASTPRATALPPIKMICIGAIYTLYGPIRRFGIGRFAYFFSFACALFRRFAFMLDHEAPCAEFRLSLPRCLLPCINAFYRLASQCTEAQFPQNKRRQCLPDEAEAKMISRQVESDNTSLYISLLVTPPRLRRHYL